MMNERFLKIDDITYINIRNIVKIEVSQDQQSLVWADDDWLLEEPKMLCIITTVDGHKHKAAYNSMIDKILKKGV